MANGPAWDAGCVGCSLVADHFDGGMIHLNQRDVTMVCISRAPLAKINAYKRRMGWRFTWVSSFRSDFNYDFGVSYTEEQRASGAEHNFKWEADPGDEGHGLSSIALLPAARPRPQGPRRGEHPSRGVTDWAAMSAADVLAALPIVVFALLVQRHLVRGLTMGAVK